MSGFLHHLAAMSLGARPEGAARLSLPPRFAGLSGGLALRQEDADFASAAAPGHFEDHAAMRPEAPGLSCKPRELDSGCLNERLDASTTFQM